MPEDTTEIPPPPRPAEYEGMDKSTGTMLIVVGVLLVGLGIVLLINPFAAIWILGVLIGVSLIIGGVAEIASGRQGAGPAWPAWVGGGIIIIGGIVAAVWPDATVWVLAVVAGVVLAVFGGHDRDRLRRPVRRPRHPARHRRDQPRHRHRRPGLAGRDPARCWRSSSGSGP